MQFSPKAGGCCCGSCGTINVTVKLCSDGSLVSGAVVTIKDSGGSTVGSGTTSGSGVVGVAIAAAGDYTVEVVKTGQSTVTVIVPATCTNNAVEVQLGRTIRYNVATCSGNVFRSGLTVTLTHATSGRVYTWTTTSANPTNAIIPVGESGTFNYSIPAFRHVTKTGTTTISPFFCSATQDQFLTADTGYACAFWTVGTGAKLCISGGTTPLATTLHLTDSALGAVVLTYGVVSGVGGWRSPAGSVTYFIPQNDGLSPLPILQITYTGGGGGTVGAKCTTPVPAPPTAALLLTMTADAAYSGGGGLTGLYGAGVTPTYTLTE